MYPKSKIFLLIVVAALIVGGAFALAESRNRREQKVVYSSPLEAATSQLSAELQDVDSDQDELKDWEELLLGTNPRIPDTDGDGTTDGDEAKVGRNPLVKGPKDTEKDAASSTVAFEKLTPSEKIARDFFSRYMELSQIGLADDAQSQEELIGLVLKNGLVLDLPTPYKLERVIVKSDSSVGAIKAYGEAAATIFNNHPHTGRDEAVIVKEALDAENPEILKELDPIIANYKAIVAALLKVPVPATYAEAHLELINATNYFLFVAESLRQSFVDPIKGIQGLKEYLNAGQALVDATTEMRNLLLKDGITYSPTEKGYMFTK